MPTPPPPAPGAEVDTFTITDAVVPASGVVDIQVDTFANKNNANDVTIVNTATDPITYITVEKFGDNDGQQDVIRIDLSEYEDDFTLEIKNAGTSVTDYVYLEGVHEFIDNGDGTFTATYYGTDSNLHSIDIIPDEAQFVPYYAPDGIVAGEDGAEVMGDGYADIHDDQIGSGDGSDDDSILGNGGSDTINGGAGNDTIIGDFADLVGRLAPQMPDYTYTGSPAGPAPGAEVDTFTINDANIDNSGKVTVKVDLFANKNNANDVTIVHGGTEDINLIEISKGGGGDGQADVYRFDLSTYDDDFNVIIADEDTFDTIVFQNVHAVTDNGDGTWSITYFGSDSALHSITVDPDTAHVAFYVTTSSPYYYDDEIDGGDGDDLIDGGYGADSILGGAGADTIIGNIGDDTIDGGAGADLIYGDWDQPLTAEIAPPPVPTAEVDSFSIGDAEINAGDVAISLDDFADPNNENDVLITDDAATESIDTISVTKLGAGDGAADVIRFDLSTFDDDFLITTNSETLEDTFVFEDVHEATDNGDGTWTITYYGEDELLHTVDIDPGIASVAVYYAPAPNSLLAPQTDDLITGGAGDDTIDGGMGNDTIDAGADNDSVLGAEGDDSIDAGTGDDYADGGFGDDTITGGDGADTLYGGDSDVEIPLERVAFRWSDVPDPDDGGQIDNLDAITTGSQTVGGTTVNFSVSSGTGLYETTTVYTGGIDAGTGTVDANSALGLDNTGGTVTMDFTTPVENLQFNINDFEDNLETIYIQAFDDQGNPITFSVVQGANITGSDTDTISGDDTFESALGEQGDNSALASVGITVAGPVAQVVITYTETGGSLTMTDLWFDDPATGTVGGGDDSLDGGIGDDVFEAGNGTDTMTGGSGTDTYDASASGDLSSETITVIVDGLGDGTAAKTNDGTTDSFTSIEDFVAGEGAAEADTITITNSVLASQATGFSDASTGTFTPDLGSSGPISFGGAGEPTINQLLGGTYIHPVHGRIKPLGTYQIDGGEEDGAQVGDTTFSNFENINFDVICFARGTRILTDRGEVEIEDLRAGDMVETLDHGLQPIRWIGSTVVPATGKNAPIQISKGALGNTRDLRVSPQHRMLLTGWQLELLFGDGEALVPAKNLVNDHSIRRVEADTVEYFHMLFDTHQIVFAEGAPSESFHPGAVGMATFTDQTREEINGIFPGLRDDLDTYGPSARVSLKMFEAKVLCDMGGLVH